MTACRPQGVDSELQFYGYHGESIGLDEWMRLFEERTFGSGFWEHPLPTGSILLAYIGHDEEEAYGRERSGPPTVFHLVFVSPGGGSYRLLETYPDIDSALAGYKDRIEEALRDMR